MEINKIEFFWAKSVGQSCVGAKKRNKEVIACIGVWMSAREEYDGKAFGKIKWGSDEGQL